MHKLYKQQGTDLIDITNYVGKITRRSTAKEISEELNFEMIYDDIYKTNTTLEEGDIILLKNNNKLYFKGVVVTRSIKGRGSISYKCFDFGWYLNKNEDIYQFNDNVSNNITRILNDYGIKIGYIIPIPTIFKNVSRGTLVNIMDENIKLAQKEQGLKYRWEMREDSFYLESLDQNVITYNTNIIADNENVNKYLKETSHSISIDGLYNAVKVAGENKNKIRYLAYTQDQNSINKYGKLQKLEYLDKDDYSKADSIAKNQLTTLNKLNEKINITVFGNDDCRANRVIEIEEPINKISGKFIINTCTHKIETIHTMTLELEVL